MNREDTRSLFWTAFWATIVLMLLAGCTTERKVVRYVENNPGVLGNWTTVDTIQTIRDTTIYRDSTIYVDIPADTVRDTITVDLPIEVPVNIISDTARAKTEYAEAEAYMVNGKIILALRQLQTKWQVKLDSIIRESDRIEELYISEITKPPPEKKRPWWALPAAIIAIFATALLVIVILRK